MRRVARFLPLLLIYVLIFAVADFPENPRGDAARYLWFARNLAHGYYSPTDRINLWNGPGYPLVLAVPVALHLPLRVAGFFNVAFMFGAVLYLYFTLRHLAGIRAATIAAYTLGLWPRALMTLPRLMTEPVSMFLACAFTFHLCRLHQTGRWRHLLPAAACLGYLALTRVIFGYVITTALGVLLVLYLVSRLRSLGRDVLVCGLALALCLPYLFYTHSLTGRSFYWGSSGGMSLYWMSSPYDGDLGDWHSEYMVINNENLARNHNAFLSTLGGLSIIEKDDAFRNKALENIRAKPLKYLRNWVANVGRLFMNHPPSYKFQKLAELIDMIPGALLLGLIVLCIRPSYLRRWEIPHEILVVLLVACIYLGGSSLLSAYSRFLLPALPFILLWITFVLSRSIRIDASR